MISAKVYWSLLIHSQILCSERLVLLQDLRLELYIPNQKSFLETNENPIWNGYRTILHTQFLLKILFNNIWSKCKTAFGIFCNFKNYWNLPHFQSFNSESNTVGVLLLEKSQWFCFDGCIFLFHTVIGVRSLCLSGYVTAAHRIHYQEIRKQRRTKQLIKWNQQVHAKMST